MKRTKAKPERETAKRRILRIRAFYVTEDGRAFETVIEDEKGKVTVNPVLEEENLRLYRRLDKALREDAFSFQGFTPKRARHLDFI